MPKAVYITDPVPTETAARVDQPTFNVLSLCSGVGGLDLGLGLAVRNARTVCYVEREAYCCEVLAERMADGCLDAAPVWTDLRTFDGRPWRGVVDCVIGGYPCQPFSVAGKRLAAADPRHLWPEVARIVREVEPSWCFFENVAGHLRLGFEQVERDLRELGYVVAAGLFTAAEVGATHKRERLFIVGRRVSDDRGEPDRRRDGPATQISGVADPEHGSRTERAGDVLAGQRAGLHGQPADGGGEAGDGDVADTAGDRPQGGWEYNAGSSSSGATAVIGRRRPTEQCAENVGDPEGTGRQQHRRGGRSEGGQSPAEISRRAVRGEQRTAVDERVDADGGTIHSGNVGDSVVYTEIVGRREGRPEPAVRSGRDAATGTGLPTWPPGPGERERWAAIVAAYPTVKPAVRGVADGMAPRVDRLRAAGNGVVPAVAALAWRTLAPVVEEVAHAEGRPPLSDV